MTEFFNLLRLLLPWEDAPNDQISDIFVYVIGVAFLLLGICFSVKTFLRLRLIKGLTKEVRGYDRPAQPAIKQELKEKFNRNRELVEAWREFEDSLITRQRENQEMVYKTGEASLFFGEDRLLPLNLRFWNSVPALLVGLGILGTFVGLVWGLIPFSDIDFTQTAQIQSAIKKLLSGVSTAFVTSVWGMLTSLLFNGWEKFGIGLVSKAIADLQSALDRLFTLTTQEEISFRQEDELAQQTAALKSFSTDLANDIKSAMAQGRQEIIQELHNVPQAFSNAMAEQLVPSLDSLNTAVEKLRQQKEESSADTIGKLIKEFQDSLSSSTVHHMEELAQTLGNQVKEMITSVQNQIDSTRQLLDATSVKQADQMKKMFDEMIFLLDSAASRTEKGMQNLLDSAASRTEEQFALRMADFESILDQQQKAIGEITAQTAAEFARASDHVEQAAAQLSNSVQNAEQSVGRILQLLQPQVESFDKQIANSQQTLKKGREMLQQMDASIVNVHQLIETMQAFSEQLTTGAKQLDGVGQQLTQASDAFNRENEKYITANRETIQQIQATHMYSKQLLDDLTQRFQTIDTGLQSIFGEMEKGLNSYAVSTRESINEYLGAFSSQLAKASNALANSVEALEENVDALNDMFDQRRNK